MTNSTRLALCDVRGPLADLNEKLSGEQAEMWLAALNRMLRKENPWPEITACPASLVFDCATFINPAEFIGENWKVWRGPPTGKGLTGDEARDPRAAALKQIDFSAIQFETCLKDGETWIRGEEKLQRLEAKIPLADNAFLALWLDYKARGENSVLEWLRKNRGINYLDFFGLVLRRPYGDRCVLCLYFDGGGWYWSCRWLDFDWSSHSLSAVSPQGST